MTFASLEFGVLLAICLPLHWLLPARGRTALLLVASYVFYAWWNPMYAVFIFITTAVDYAAALVIARSATPRGRKLALAVSVSSNLGMLAYFKYTNFALDSLRALLGPLGTHLPGPLDIVLPAGISFYTFQTMSYTIDVYRGTQRAERDFVLVACYVAFFPQLVAGPIERARTLMPQLGRARRLRMRDLERGFREIAWGLLKKLVVADRLTVAAYPVFLDPGAHGTGELAFAAAAMLIVIYLDFSAYSEIASGTARLFGVRLTRNFLSPMAAGNVAEYWRRWHVTLSRWIADYVYVPLGGRRPRSAWHAAGLTLLATGLIGLWHGAAWTFIVWGLANGLSLIGYQLLRRRVLVHVDDRLRRSVPWRLGSWMATTVVRVPISVLFFAPSVAATLVFWNGLVVQPTAAGFELPHIQLGIAVVVVFWVVHWLNATWPFARVLDRSGPWSRALAYAALVLVVLFRSVDRSAPFIYFQF
jgi:D-alanyl-lipoteichoic acid acyltransferase DltB (MBOAT superfamily)